MKYEPWKVIEEAFRKHMKVDTDKKFNEMKEKEGIIFHYDTPEQYYEEQLAHNFEYFKWYVDGTTGDVVFDRYETYTPLGLFYGQEEAIPQIRANLVTYVTHRRGFLLRKITNAMFKLTAERIEPEEIHLPNDKNGYDWYSLVGGFLFGLKIKSGKPAKVLSRNQYGRFVEIEGLE